MKTFTYEDIESWSPCYCPSKHLPTNWKGTALDILKMDKIIPQDRLWAVCRDEALDEKTLRSFVVFCAVQVKHLMLDDSKESLEVMESYAENYFLIDDDAWRAAWELERYLAFTTAKDARANARAAGVAATKFAAGVAVVAAMDDAGVAVVAAMDDAGAATVVAVRTAKFAAGANISRYITEAISDAADSAANSALDDARAAQIEKLIEIIEETK